MSFAEAVNSRFSQYARFSGRARRSELWYWTLFVGLVSALDAVLEQVVFRDTGHDISTSVLGLLFLLPTLAVSVRRLHDTSRTGWWYLIQAIPVLGAIVLIVFSVQDSHGDNQYGPSPTASVARPATAHR